MTDDAQSLAEQCGISVHATEALLCNLQEQKIKQAMASSYIAPGALEGKYSQIYDLDRNDKMYVREDGTPVFKLHERYDQFFVPQQHELLWRARSNPNPKSRQTSHSECNGLWNINYNYGVSPYLRQCRRA